jgi:hypothetical protein
VFWAGTRTARTCTTRVPMLGVTSSAIKRMLGRPRRRWEDTITIDLRETE